VSSPFVCVVLFVCCVFVCVVCLCVWCRSAFRECSAACVCSAFRVCGAEVLFACVVW